MKVVLSGYFGFDNVGDEAILHSLIQGLRDVDSTLEITVLSNQPKETERVYGVNAVNRWKMGEVLKVIRESSGLISGGGSLLQDKTGGKSVIYYCGIMWLAKLARKPIIVYSQGMGPLQKLKSKKIVQATLNQCAMISVRDQASKQLLQDIGVKKEMEVVPDSVMGMSFSKEASQHWISKELVTDDFITIAIRDWPEGKGHLKKMMHSFNELVNDGHQLVFLPMHGEQDHATAQQMISEIKVNVGQPQPRLFPYDATVHEKAALAGRSKLLVGMRLHALIFAAVGGRPFVALSYDPKIDAFAELCHQDVAVHVEDDDWTADTLTAVINSYLEELSEKEIALNDYAQRAKKEARETISKTYKHLLPNN